MPTEAELRAAYIVRVPAVCLDCGDRVLPDVPCGNHGDDYDILGVVYPPYVFCTENAVAPDLPENAGRHPAPGEESEALKTIGELTALRSLGGQRHCF